MKDVSFGQLYPVDSIIHRMDPRAKLLITIAYIVMLFFVDSFIVYGIIAVLLLIVILISRVPPLKVLSSVKAIIFLLVFTFTLTVVFNQGQGEAAELERFGWYAHWGIFTVCGSGLILGGKLVCRLLLLVLGPTMLTFTTTPVALTDAIESLLTPLKWIKVPVHAFAMIMSIALSLIPGLMEETQKIMNAQKARGAAFDHGNIFKRAAALLPVLIPLFVSSFKRSDDLADAMDSRCYRGAKGRTKMKVLKFRLKDYLAMLLTIALFFFILVLFYNWWSWPWVGLVTLA